jgi:hypothetical protein
VTPAGEGKLIAVTVDDQDLVKSIFESCRELSRRTGRHISPDGHLVGSLGEVYAAEKLHLQLQTASNAGYDALDTHGRRVEIKTTTRASIGLSTHGNTAERLIVIHLDPNTGTPTIVYDGEAAPAWELAGAPQKNGQRKITLTTLTATKKMTQSHPPHLLGCKIHNS